MDLSKTYRFSRGFAFRRESFGGILFHFEGRRPDPKLYFVDSPFLIGLLELLEEGPLEELIDQARLRFALTPAEVAIITGFLATLAGRGALVAQ